MMAMLNLRFTELAMGFVVEAWLSAKSFIVLISKTMMSLPFTIKYSIPFKVLAMMLTRLSIAC